MADAQYRAIRPKQTVTLARERGTSRRELRRDLGKIAALGYSTQCQNWRSGTAVRSHSLLATTAVFSKQRSTSATLPAWALQRRGVTGGSASKTSLIVPMPASARSS